MKIKVERNNHKVVDAVEAMSTTCPKCGSELEYTNADVSGTTERRINGISDSFILCMNCRHRIGISDGKQKIKG